MKKSQDLGVVVLTAFVAPGRLGTLMMARVMVTSIGSFLPSRASERSILVARFALDHVDGLAHAHRLGGLAVDLEDCCRPARTPAS